ncbi:hypothetical protein [Streptomyces sp. NEAU-H3]|uniref:hypothetical protein n=1 Tax=Streptomyces sp. NEAU-H3 TaxID=2720636 RepID=UPI001439092B|nr:hypothetical protein [Streptomyces sp. NEAU-H3]NJA59961.1 hypothetical protein [Streptomyces sp. NEAU-H3]
MLREARDVGRITAAQRGFADAVHLGMPDFQIADAGCTAEAAGLTGLTPPQAWARGGTRALQRGIVAT